ncbi:MAG TPA: hypothetical protein VHC95_02910 [Opitutales bacterium]|nr:hypothetical protein [Opitutales bacterium]
MPEPTSKPPRKISLEELLRLKRHERPGAEHWVRFDRELNEKVWRSLANPPAEERTGWIPHWLFRGLRWMTGGAIAAATVILAWPSHPVVPVAALAVHAPAGPSAPTVAATPVTPAAAPIRIASAAPIPEDVISSAKATFALSDLDPVTSPAGNNKIPATLSFPVDAGHERFAGGPLDTVAFVSRLHGSAY